MSRTRCQIRTSGWSYTENASSAASSGNRQNSQPNNERFGSRSMVSTRSKPSAPESSAAKNVMVDGKRTGMRGTEAHTRGDDSTT